MFTASPEAAWAEISGCEPLLFTLISGDSGESARAEALAPRLLLALPLAEDFLDLAECADCFARDDLLLPLAAER